MTVKDMLIKVTPFLLVFRTPIIVRKFYGRTGISLPFVKDVRKRKSK